MDFIRPFGDVSVKRHHIAAADRLGNQPNSFHQKKHFKQTDDDWLTACLTCSVMKFPFIWNPPSRLRYRCVSNVEMGLTQTSILNQHQADTTTTTPKNPLGYSLNLWHLINNILTWLLFLLLCLRCMIGHLMSKQAGAAASICTA